MVIDERSRHALFTRLQEVIGEEEAAVLMEHLPPVGWADVATKHDLDHLQTATKKDLDHLRESVRADLHEGLYRQTRTVVTWMLAAMSILTVTMGALTRLI